MKKNDDDSLKEAENILTELLPSVSAKAAPGRWANLNNNLAAVLNTRANYQDDVSLAHHAVEVLGRSAQQVHLTESRAAWLIGQLNLAAALVNLGQREGDLGLLEEALDITEVVQEQTGEAASAKIRFQLGLNKANALLAIDNRAVGPGRVEVLLPGFNHPHRSAAQQENPPIDWFTRMKSLQKVTETQERLEKSTHNMLVALDAINSALSAGSAYSDQSTSNAVYLKAAILLRLGERTEDTKCFDDADKLLEKELARIGVKRNVALAGRIHQALGSVASARVMLTGDKSLLAGSIQNLEQACAAYEQAGLVSELANARALLAHKIFLNSDDDNHEGLFRARDLLQLSIAQAERNHNKAQLESYGTLLNLVQNSLGHNGEH